MKPNMHTDSPPNLPERCDSLRVIVVLDDRLPRHHCFGENRIKGDGTYEGVIFFFRILLDLTG